MFTFPTSTALEVKHEGMWSGDIDEALWRFDRLAMADTDRCLTLERYGCIVVS